MEIGAQLYTVRELSLIHIFGAAEDGSQGIIDWLFNVGITASEALPLLLFIGIGAMIDFGPLLSNPKMFLFGAAAQFGIFFTVLVASFFFPFKDAAAIGIIGAADGPTSILVSRIFNSQYIGAIAVAAYSYMALVPIIQPAAIKLVTTKKERQIRMPYNPQSVSRKTRILFPIIAVSYTHLDVYKRQAPHRSLLKALGITDSEMKRPFVAVVSSKSCLLYTSGYIILIDIWVLRLQPD